MTNPPNTDRAADAWAGLEEACAWMENFSERLLDKNPRARDNLATIVAAARTTVPPQEGGSAGALRALVMRARGEADDLNHTGYGATIDALCDALTPPRQEAPGGGEVEVRDLIEEEFSDDVIPSGFGPRDLQDLRDRVERLVPKIIAVLCPAQASAREEIERLLDFEPDLGAATREPSLRSLVQNYYLLHGLRNDSKRYIAALNPEGSKDGGAS